jgi:flagellin
MSLGKERDAFLPINRKINGSSRYDSDLKERHMSVINTNVSAILTQNSLVKNERAMSGAMEQLSTGKRINSSADDAAGLSIASRMTAQINGLNQAVRNGNDAISLVQTADGALIEVTSMLQRMRTLAVQSASDSNTTADRTALNTEFELLRTEINRIGTNTQWNGENVLDQSHSSSTGTYKFQVGANGDQTVNLTIDNYTTSGAGSTTATITSTAAGSSFGLAAAKQSSTLTLTGTPAEGDKVAVSVGDKSIVYTVTAANVAGSTAATDLGNIATSINTALGTISGVGTTVTATAGTITFLASSGVFGSNSFEIGSSKGNLGGIATSDIKTLAASNTSIAALDTAIAAVNTGRSKMGATINVLQYAVDNLANVSLNATASRSRVEDTDYSSVTTELARTQIIAQAATAMLAQANQIPQTVLSLLK